MRVLLVAVLLMLAADAAAQSVVLPFAAEVAAAAARHGVDPAFIHAVIAIESSHRRDAVSRVGAQGLMQLMPGTQLDLGVTDPFDARDNIDAGVAYLRKLADEFGTVVALAAYNAGPGAVRRHGGVPPFPETRRFVRAVIGALIRQRAGLPPR